jgi:hypothetical protein
MKGSFTVRLAPLLLLTALVACGKQELPPEKPTLIVSSRVVFVEPDGKTPRAAPTEPLRIWAPTLVGDLYGSPNEGEIVPVELKKDLTFTMNLNGAGEKLEKGLVPTQFSQKWMAIEPADARVARVLPFVMPADNIGPVGVSEWLDEESGAKLMLAYVDRPARIRGDIVFEGRSLQFDIEAPAAGYFWIRQPEGNGMFRAAPWPKNVVLAVFPGE